MHTDRGDSGKYSPTLADSASVGGTAPQTDAEQAGQGSFFTQSERAALADVGARTQQESDRYEKAGLGPEIRSGAISGAEAERRARDPDTPRPPSRVQQLEMQVEAQALVIDSLQREGLGIEMQQFSKQLQKFDTEDKAEAWFVEQRWPSGVACPFCGTLNIAVVASRKPQPFRCREKECRKSFSVKTGTLLHSSNLPLSQWAIAFFLYATNLKGVSSMKLHRDLGIAQSSAWYMAHRIRGMWTAEAHKFAGPVEVDETYIGGKERNKHESKKIHAGRGAVGKAAAWPNIPPPLTVQVEAIATYAMASTCSSMCAGFFCCP